jgi:hypothetical protein
VGGLESPGLAPGIVRFAATEGERISWHKAVASSSPGIRTPGQGVEDELPPAGKDGKPSDAAEGRYDVKNRGWHVFKPEGGKPAGKK